MNQQTMQATWYDQQGDANEVIQFGQLPLPEPGFGEVRIRVHASGVNPSDTKGRSGWGGIVKSFDRIIPHQDGAGIIERIGEGVSPNRIGERVWIYEAQLDCQFSLEQVAAAHEAQDSGQVIGKVLIEIA